MWQETCECCGKKFGTPDSFANHECIETKPAEVPVDEEEALSTAIHAVQDDIGSFKLSDVIRALKAAGYKIVRGK